MITWIFGIYAALLTVGWTITMFAFADGKTTEDLPNWANITIGILNLPTLIPIGSLALLLFGIEKTWDKYIIWKNNRFNNEGRDDLIKEAKEFLADYKYKVK